MVRPGGMAMLTLALTSIAAIAGAFAMRGSEAAEPSGFRNASAAEKGSAREQPDALAPDCEDGPASAFRDYLGVPDRDDDADAALRNAMQDERFRMVVVTIADPIDSRLDAAFDQTLTGIGLAAAHLRYTLDRFWLPWQLDRREIEEGHPEHACRTRQAGVVLYRPVAARPEEGAPRKPPLAFLLVGETPTTGIHRFALERALELIEKTGRAAEEPITIIGPTFSGSTASLARELAKSDRSFDVVTGSAADGKSLAQLSSRPRVRFRSTAHRQEDFWSVLMSYLRHVGVPTDQLAILVESDTAFGGGVAAGLLDTVDPSFRERPPILLRFPVHVSRIRSDLDRQRRRQQVVVGGYALPELTVGLRDDPQLYVKDVPPMLSATSENYEEEVLAGELGSLRRRGIRAAAVLATDPRDRSFLVAKLRELVPEALLFTVGSDLLSLYPDLQRAMQGTLVLSTYPLFADAQSWTASGPRLERVQFASGIAEGTHNAAILALAQEHERARLLLDYGCPFQNAARDSRAPPTWISVVGGDAFWPVWADCHRGSAVPAPHLRTWMDAHATSTPVRRVHTPEASRSMLVLTAVLALYAVANALAAFAARGLAPWGPWLHLGHYAPAPASRSHRVWLVVHLGCLALVVLVVAVILFIPGSAGVDPEILAPRSTDWTSVVARLAAAGAGVALGAAGWVAWEHARPRGGRIEGPALPDTRTLLAAAIAVAVPAMALALVAPVVAGFAQQRLGAAWTMLLFERAVHLGSGVSPLPPVLFAALGLHLAMHYQLMRLRDLDGDWRGQLLGRSIQSRDPAFAAADEDVARLSNGQTSLRERSLAVVFVLVPSVVLLPGSSWTPSPEGPGFDLMYRLLLEAATAAAGLSLWRSCRLWAALRKVLVRLPDNSIGAALRRVPELYRPGRVRRLLRSGPEVADLEVSCRLFCAAFPNSSWADARERIDRNLGDGRALVQGGRWRGKLALLEEAAVLAAAIGEEAGPRRADDGGPRARAIEDFLASQLALKLFCALAHLRRLVTFSVAGALAVLFAVALRYQPSGRPMLLMWLIVLGAVASAVVIHVQQARDEVLRWLHARAPGASSFDVSSIPRYVSLGAAPLLALLAFEFPGFGRWIAGWLGPVFGAMK